MYLGRIWTSGVGWAGLKLTIPLLVSCYCWGFRCGSPCLIEKEWTVKVPPPRTPFVLEELFFVTNERNTNSKKVKQQMKFIGLLSLEVKSDTARSGCSSPDSGPFPPLASGSAFVLFFGGTFLWVSRCLLTSPYSTAPRVLSSLCPYPRSRKCTKDSVRGWAGGTLGMRRMGFSGWVASYCANHRVPEGDGTAQTEARDGRKVTLRVIAFGSRWIFHGSMCFLFLNEARLFGDKETKMVNEQTIQSRPLKSTTVSYSSVPLLSHGNKKETFSCIALLVESAMWEKIKKSKCELGRMQNNDFSINWLK